MKILCISDQIDPVVYSSAIKTRFADVDIILSAGDLPMDYLDFIVSSLNKPLLFVFGNHHIDKMENNGFQGYGCIHAGSKVIKEEGLIVAGLGGSMRYNRGANQFTEFQMRWEIFKLIPRLLWNKIFSGRALDILLTHAPPWGIHDKKDKCHWGFKAFLWFIKRFKPKYLIHGHIHLYDLSDRRITRWMHTQVINAYSHYVINTALDE
ncbi:MAG: metallophosphoesterase [Treponema sp.]|nr:metallophosphoesterase [Treponema sp.]